MTDIDYSASDLEIRPDLVEAHRRAWKRLGQPGTWLTGDERVAVAQETRHAQHCRLCAARLEALSPRHVSGDHDICSSLDPAWIEVIHVIRTDQSRITDAWFDEIIERGVFNSEYVEMTAVIATVLAVDGFCDALGVPRHELPATEPGEPTQTMPAGAKARSARRAVHRGLL